MEKFQFKTSSGIKSIVGKDLITDRYVAIFELVKNAYDARASQVVVSFNDTGKSASITIFDNGTGMSKDDISNKWLYLAYSDKKEGRSNDDRAFVGSKGVGRFSCDSLGKRLILRTKTMSDSVEHTLHINWPDFEGDLKKRFEQIDVSYESKPAKKNESYTILEILELHDSWSEKEIAKVKDSLRRLKNPFQKNDGFKLYCGENIKSAKPIDLVESNIAEVLKDKCITIHARIDKNITVQLTDRGRVIYKVHKENKSVFESVPIDFTVNYLTTSAKSTFTRRMGVAPINFGNIFIYRNGFRVNPYGNTDYDLFGLNMRKNQGYNRFIGTREIIGHVDIIDKNNYFKETSSRNNGFIQNIYFSELEAIYIKYVHRPLERYVTLIQWGEESGKAVHLEDVNKSLGDKFISDLSSKNGFSLDFFAKNINFDEHDPKKKIDRLVDSLPEDKKEIAREVSRNVSSIMQDNEIKGRALTEQSAVISALERQNKNLITSRSQESFGEQISHHFGLMSERLQHGIDELGELRSSLDKSAINRFNGALRKIKRTEIELRLFKDLLLKSNHDMRSAQIINWYTIAEKFLSDKSKITRRFKVVCNINSVKNIELWNIRCNVLEYVMALENLCQNAIEHGAKYVDFQFSASSVVISSDSSAIDKNNLEKIFELGFSTKPNGTGIGLNQVKLFFNKAKFNISARNRSGQVQFVVKVME